MDVTWGRIRSWHAVQPSRAIEPRSLCGRVIHSPADWSEALPPGKSCETCLRILAKRQGE